MRCIGWWCVGWIRLLRRKGGRVRRLSGQRERR